MPNRKDITATKPESKQTGSECKHFARFGGVPNARRKTRWSARRETRRPARRETRRSAHRETRRSARRETRRSARCETRRLRVARRAGCAPCARTGDAPDARRVRARARPFFLRGGGRRLEVVVRRRPGVADGAASPGRPGRGASPSTLAATGSSTQHLSQSRGARSRASCSGRLSVEMSSSFAERDAEEANGEAEIVGRGRTQSS